MKTILLFLALLFNCYFTNAQNLVAYYPFNGNANDESGNSNNGTVNGAALATDRFGGLDSSYYFDGNDYIICNTQVGPFGTGSRTISFWAKTDVAPNVNSQQNTVLSYGQWPTGGGRFEVLINPKCRGIGVDVSNNYTTSSFDNSDNNWHFYSVVFDNTISNKLSDLKFYADGNLLTTVCNTNGDITLNTLNTEALNIGRLFYTGQPRYFKGNIDDIRIYSSALSDADILNLYNFNSLKIEKIENVAENFFYVNNNILYFKNIQNLQEIKTIEVYNLLGQKVFETSKIEKEIQLEQLQQGIYILKVETLVTIQTLKIIIY